MLKSILNGRGLWAYGIVTGIYCLLRLPTVWVSFSYPSLVFPTSSLYFSRLLFDGFGIRSDIAGTVINPSNAALIYPPGIYIISALVGKVRDLFWVLFLTQLMVGPLIFFLMKKIVPRAVALLLALLAVYYFTKADWWSPDFLIQPLMIVGAILLINTRRKPDALFPLLILGLIAGLIILFKHNVGVFFSILCVAWFFLSAFKPSPVPLRPFQVVVIGVLMACFIGFIPIIGLHFKYTDEWLFYLLPYAAFWGLFSFYLLRTSLQFNSHRFLKDIIGFGAGSLLFPGLMFVALGSVIGFSRYWHSLFGMGLKYQHLWDTGISGVIGRHIHFFEGGIRGFIDSYNSLTYLALFLLPFTVNLLVVAIIGRVVCNAYSPYRSLMLFRIGCLGVMAVFMFFPLEGYQILSTKLFIFVFVGVYFLKLASRNAVPVLGYTLRVLLLPVILIAGRNVCWAASIETDQGSPAIQRVIGLPLRNEIAAELSRQVEVVSRSVKGQPYYVIDSSGGTLIGLASFEDNRLPQYYIEMRPGLIDREVVAAIKADLATRPYVVIRTKDYLQRNEVSSDPGLRQIVSFVDAHYWIVDAYKKPASSSSELSQVQDFLVLMKRGDDFMAEPAGH